MVAREMKGIVSHTEEKEKEMNDKRVCTGCDHRCEKKDVLRGQNPFKPSITVGGCPTCFAVDSMRYTCDEKDCWLSVTAGTPTAEGYKSTCNEHIPRRKTGERNESMGN